MLRDWAGFFFDDVVVATIISQSMKLQITTSLCRDPRIAPFATNLRLAPTASSGSDRNDPERAVPRWQLCLKVALLLDFG
jgi:hypothetical protein